MTVVDGGASSAGLISRVKNILIKPRTEWDVIEAEPTTVKDIYVRYACILAAIPSICQLIASQVFGRGLPGIITYKPSLVASLSSAILSYVLALVGVFIVAVIIDALAPSFGAVKNQTQAFKVAAYSSTAAWVGGIFLLLPPLAILAVLAAFYGVYLLYLGLPKLMRAPDDKSIAYTVVSILVAIVVYWIAAAIVGSIVLATVGFAGLAGADRVAEGSGGVVTIGGRQVDVGRLQDTAREMERTAKQMQSGETTSIPADQIQALLPASLAGMTRTSLSTDTAGALGSGAHARYEKGESSIDLSIADSAMGRRAGQSRRIVRRQPQRNQRHRLREDRRGQRPHDPGEVRSRQPQRRIQRRSRQALHGPGHRQSGRDGRSQRRRERAQRRSA